MEREVYRRRQKKKSAAEPSVEVFVVQDLLVWRQLSPVIAEIFIRGLLSFISYFLLKERKISSTRKPYMCTIVYDAARFAVRKFIPYESSRALEYKIFMRSQISVITVFVMVGDNHNKGCTSQLA